jgi:hypothetical protein
MKPISSERQHIARVFKTHIEEAFEEVGVGYEVTLQGKFDSTPISDEMLLSIALSPVASALGLFIGPFALTDSLLILSAFFMYRMSKSLVPVIAKTNL